MTSVTGAEAASSFQAQVDRLRVDVDRQGDADEHAVIVECTVHDVRDRIGDRVDAERAERRRRAVRSALDDPCRGLDDGRWPPGPIVGVQFHPESFMTPAGSALLANFLRM